jgi:hypothetical protein
LYGIRGAQRRTQENGKEFSMSLINVSNVGLFSAQADNRGRFDHNDFGGDSSNSKSFNRSRGHRSKGHNRKRGGHKRCDD